jgi:long-chain acyl-CoA synthetase
VQNICCHAEANKNKPIAIIIPAEPLLKQLAESNGVTGKSYEDLCQDKKVNGLVLKELQNAGKSGGLAGIELIDGVVLSSDEWTPENGLVTSAQKLNRKGLLEKYKKEVDAAYKGDS